MFRFLLTFLLIAVSVFGQEAAETKPPQISPEDRITLLVAQTKALLKNSQVLQERLKVYESQKQLEADLADLEAKAEAILKASGCAEFDAEFNCAKAVEKK